MVRGLEARLIPPAGPSSAPSSWLGPWVGPWVALLALSACGGGPASATASAEAAAAATHPRNLLLVSIDTLRADHLGCYGYPRAVSPRLDAFAAAGIRFEYAMAPAPYTATSHTSLFTSLYPATHHIWNKMRLPNGAKAFPALPPAATTLAEVLQDAGFQTAAIAGGGYINERRGLDQGFQLFDSQTLGAENRVDRALRWLREERDPAKPFFLFLHTYEVHYPYLPPEDVVDRFDPDYQGPLREALREARRYLAENRVKNPIGDIQRLFFQPLFEGDLDPADREFVSALYDAEIAVTDAQLGRFLDALAAAGLERDTLVVILADHGEEFWEHGYFGHHKVWEQLLHIPLLVRLPGGPSGVVRTDSLDLVDVMPTVLAELGVAAPPSVVGRVVDLRHSPADPRIGPAIAQANWPNHQASYRAGTWKAIFFPDEGFPTAVFDLATDPAESRNLADTPEGKDFLRRARHDLSEFQKRSIELRQRFHLAPIFHSLEELSPESRAELQGLGYVGDDQEGPR